jgi:hypothetical protein
LRLLERRSIEDLLTVLDGPDDPGDAVRAERLNDDPDADLKAARRILMRDAGAWNGSDDHDCDEQDEPAPHVGPPCCGKVEA